MSYDLFLRPAKGDVTESELSQYFEQRPFYEVHENQIWYQNNNTGVYFSFERNEGEEDEVEDEDGGEWPIMFNLNFFRPHYFGLEAADELHSFVTEFKCAIFDPQNDAMENGLFTVEGFLKSWNSGNSFGHRAMLSQQNEAKVNALPTERLQAIWEWNFAKASRQERLGDDVFVPGILFFQGEDRPLTAVIWPECCPIQIPTVDLVIVYRGTDGISPATPDDAEQIFVNFDQLIDVLPPPSTRTRPLTWYNIVEPTEEQFERIQSLPSLSRSYEILPFDQVLNAELLSQAKSP